MILALWFDSIYPPEDYDPSNQWTIDRTLQCNSEIHYWPLSKKYGLYETTSFIKHDAMVRKEIDKVTFYYQLVN